MVVRKRSDDGLTDKEYVRKAWEIGAPDVMMLVSVALVLIWIILS